MSSSRSKGRSSRRAKRHVAGRRWKWIVGLGTLALLVWFLPTFIGWSPLRNRIANQLLGDAEGTVEVGSLSLGWLSPVKAKSITWIDRDGQPLLEAGELQSSRVLLSILTHTTDPGTFEINQARVHVDVFEENGLPTTNWEQALAKILNRESSGEEMTPVTLLVKDAELIVRGVSGSERTIFIPGLEFNSVPKGGNVLATLSIGNDVWQGGRAALLLKQQSSPPFKVVTSDKVTSDTESKRYEVSNGYEVEIEFDRFDLDNLATLLERLGPDTRLSGIATGGLQAVANPSLQTYRLEAESLNIENVAVSTPVLFEEGEQLQSAQLTLRGKFSIEQRLLKANDLTVESDFGNAKLNGLIDFDQVVNSPFQIDRYQDFNVEGTLDVAQLTKMLPHTLRMKDDVQVRSGTLNVTAYSRTEANDRRLFIDLQSNNLSANTSARELTFNEPLRLSLSARQTASGSPVLEFFEGRSDFVVFQGSGDFEKGELTGRANLNRLREQLEQFIEIEKLQLAGDMDLRLNWQAAPASPTSAQSESPIQIGGNATFHNLKVGSTDSAVHEERQIQCVFSTSVDADSLTSKESSVWRFGPGFVQVQSGSDQATVKWETNLQLPIEDPIRVGVQVTGELNSLVTHVESSLPEAISNIRGNLSLNGVATISNKAIQLEQAPFSVGGFRVSGDGFNVYEDQLNGDLRFAYDRSTGSVSLANTQFAGSTLSCLIHDLVLANQQTKSQVEGTVALRTNLIRLRTWFPSVSESDYRLRGEVAGDVGITINDKAMTLGLNLESESLQLASRFVDSQGAESFREVWTEDQVTIRGDVRQIWDKDQWRLTKLTVASPRVAIQGDGFVTRPAEDCRINIEGIIETDLKPLSDAALPWTYGMAQFRGRTQNPFHVVGRLGEPTSAAGTEEADSSPPGLNMTASLSWDEAYFVGIPTKASSITAKMKRSVLTTEQFRISTEEGSLTTKPTIRFDNSEPRLVLDEPTVIENLRLTPQITSGWISYVAPVFAGATSTSGTLSAQINQADIPLQNPFGGTADGVLVIQEGQVSPGPTTRQVISLVAQIRTLLLGGPGAISADRIVVSLPAQQTKFRLVEGRMFHDRLAFNIDQLVVSTTGSIGSDQSLDLMMTIAIPPSWVDGRPIAAALAREPIRVPVRGTLERPVIDQDVLKGLSQGMLRGAASDFLDDQLRRGLKSLFGGDNE